MALPEDGTVAQTDLLMSDIGKLESELLKLRAEVSDLKEQLSKSVLKQVMN